MGAKKSLGRTERRPQLAGKPRDIFAGSIGGAGGEPNPAVGYSTVSTSGAVCVLPPLVPVTVRTNSACH
jgi:hypothetical protein